MPKTYNYQVAGDMHSVLCRSFNGQSGGRLLGGVMASSITITEVIP